MTPFQTANLRLEATGPDTATLWLDVADRPVNVFNRQVVADLDAALDHVAADASIKILLVRSAKASGFIAGADLQEFVAVQGPEDAVALSERGQRLFDKVSNLPQTTVAVIHGPCLGGGLECALACDYRVVIDLPKTQLGLPEIELGLLPGWGGTQRLPRVVGLEKSLKMILAGKRLNAKEALRDGLADSVAATEAELPGTLESLLSRARREGKRTGEAHSSRNWRQRLLETNPIGRYLIFRGAEKTLKQRVPDDMPAPFEALKAVQTGIALGLEAGLAAEREAIGRLAVTPACHNLIHLFFQREKSRKLPAEVRADLVKPVKRVGIVGAGTMGAGIAQLATVRGFEVIIQEVNDDALAAGMKKIEDLFTRAVAHRVMSEDEAKQKFAAIQRTTTWEGFGHADLVVEAVIEDLELKRGVFTELERRTKPEALLATNTSSLLVAGLQEGRERPGRIGGLHFFNPVHKMPLVEVVRGPATDEATVATLTQWAIDLGKMPVVVKDSPGFLVNRVLMPYLNEAVLLLAEDVPGFTAAEIDKVMRRFGMPMGPLELLDQIGLDVAAHIEKSMRPALGGRFPSNLLFERMYEKGWLGQKSGIGFYRYQGKAKQANLEVVNLIPNELKPISDGVRVWKDSISAIYGNSRDRMVLLMANEAAACLGEGLAESAEQIDSAMVFGTGWAPHLGGPLHYADSRSLGEVVRTLEQFSSSLLLQRRFEPCAELRRRAESGESFFQSSPVVVKASERNSDKLTV